MDRRGHLWQYRVMTRRSKSEAAEAANKAAQDALRRQWLLDFDGVIWHYEGGYMALMEISEITMSEHHPEGFAYCFTFHEPRANGKEGARIYGLDNNHSPDNGPTYDHERKTQWKGHLPGSRPKESKPTRYPEASIGKAFERFPAEVAKIMERLQLSGNPIGESKAPQRIPKGNLDDEGGRGETGKKKSKKGEKR